MSTVDARALVGKVPIKKIHLGISPEMHPERWEAFNSISEAWDAGKIDQVADYYWEARSHNEKDQTSRRRNKNLPVFDGEIFYWLEYEGNSAVGAWTAGVFATDLDSALKKIRYKAGLVAPPMTRRERLKAVKKLDGDAAKKILAEIVGDCIEGGRKHDMRSTDILDSICDVLMENGLGR